MSARTIVRVFRATARPGREQEFADLLVDDGDRLRPRVSDGHHVARSRLDEVVHRRGPGIATFLGWFVLFWPLSHLNHWLLGGVGPTCQPGGF